MPRVTNKAVAEKLAKSYTGKIYHISDWDLVDAWLELKIEAGHDLKPNRYGEYGIKLSDDRIEKIWNLYMEDL